MIKSIKKKVKKVRTMVKAYREVKKMSNTIKKATTNKLKPGWKTSEFWMTIIGHLLNLLGIVNGIIDPTIGLIVSGVLQCVYNILRDVLKIKVDASKSNTVVN